MRNYGSNGRDGHLSFHYPTLKNVELGGKKGVNIYGLYCRKWASTYIYSVDIKLGWTSKITVLELKTILKELGG
eukprot:SAG11_NODE_11118_length_782_cov_3.114202_2_plen_74_part_00